MIPFEAVDATDAKTEKQFGNDDTTNIEEKLATESLPDKTNIEKQSDDMNQADHAHETKEPTEEDESKKLAKEVFASALKTLNSSTLKKANGWAQMNKAADMGNTDAKIKIAFAKLLGNDYFSQDLEEAKMLFEKAANEEGQPEAQFGLGFLYATGTMTNSSQATALLHYTFAAFGGNSWAQMALG